MVIGLAQLPKRRWGWYPFRLNPMVVIMNGGGYDDFVNEMLGSLHTKPVVLNAADISGYDQHPADGEFNEHLWYDLPTVDKVAMRLESAFATARPHDAGTFEANEKRFASSVEKLRATETQLKAEHKGEGAAITEPVPLYMLNAIGLVDKTPQEFSEAIEQDTDVAASVLQDTLALYSSHAVKLLAYNEQTTGAQTEAVLKAAKDNDIPVVPVTETLPTGKDYVSWMTDNVNNISAALDK